MSEENQIRIAEIISEDLNLFGTAAVNTAYGLHIEKSAFEVYCEMFNIITKWLNYKCKISLALCLTSWFSTFQKGKYL